MEKFEWTRGQLEAIRMVTAFLDSEQPIFLLTGSAGVGKTSVAATFPSLVTWGDTIATAPTHKAVGVLREKLEDLDCMTIHKFLGLKPKKVKDTTMLVRHKKYDPTIWLDVKVILCDEASMLSPELQNFIKEDAAMWGRQYILLGDGYQLPPPGHKHSPIFDLDLPEDCKLELTEIVRQAADNPIIALATGVRDAIISKKEPPLKQRILEGKGIFLLNQREWDAKLAEFIASPEFHNDPDHMRILAYKNDTCMKYNMRVRQMLHKGDQAPFSIGDVVTANEAWTVDDEVYIVTGQEFTIAGAVPYTHEVYPKLKGYQLDLVELPDMPVYALDYLESIEEYKKQVQLCTIEGRQTGDWQPYFKLTEFYVDLRPGYCLTVHKCFPLDRLVLTPGGVVEGSTMSLDSTVISGNGNPKPIPSLGLTGVKPEYEIRTRSGRSFITSAEHKYLTREGVYTMASELTPGEHICLYRGRTNHVFSFDLDYYGYGYLVGNGCYSYPSNRVDATMHQDSSTIPLLRQFMGKYGAKVHTYLKGGGNKALTLSCEQKSFRQELQTKGLHRVIAKDKDFCSQMTLNQQANFIRGLMDSDGSCTPNHAFIRLVSTSKRVVDKVALLLQNFGIIATISCRPAGDKFNTEAYTLGISGGDALIFQEHIGFSEEYKSERLHKGCAKLRGKSNVDFIPNSEALVRDLKQAFKSSPYFNRSRVEGVEKFHSALSHNNLSFHQLSVACRFLESSGVPIPGEAAALLSSWFFYDQITWTGYTGRCVPMMDIEVQDDHSFILDGAVVHNSQGSTYSNVMLDFHDVYSNRTLSEADRCYYVAVTRARYSVYVLSGG